jgi:hypothetical protein
LLYCVERLNTNILRSVLLGFPFSSMLEEAASSALAAAPAGSSTSIPSSATDLAAVTVAAASSEANTRPPSIVSVDITATTVTAAADVADDACYDPAVNVDGGPSPAALDDDTYKWGARNTSVQVAYFSGLRLRRLSMDALQKVWICRRLLGRGQNGGRRSIAHTSILTLCVLLKVHISPISR